VRLKKPTELFEQRRLQSLAEEDAKKEKVEVKNKRIISPKELFGEVVEVEEPLIVEEIVEEPVNPYLEEIGALRNDLERISYAIPEETDLTEVYQDIKNLKNRIDSLPKQKSYNEDIESIREELARVEGRIPVPEVFDPSNLYKNISALKDKIEQVQFEIPSIPEPILYDYQLDQLKEMVVDVRNSIPVIPEIRYYENELNEIINAIEEVRFEIPVVPEIKYYDDEISTIELRLVEIQESIPIVKYYDEDVKELKEQIISVKESIPVVPIVKYYDEDVKELKEQIISVKESIPVVPEVKYYDEDIQGLNEEIQELYKKVLSIKIPDQDKYIREVKGLYSSFEEKNHRLLEKINYLEKVFDNFNEKTLLNEGLLNEPPEIKTKDPLTPLDQNFVTLDQLQSHYKLFINRIQQQLSTIGGGGETRLEFLDDVDRTSAKNDGYVLAYQASTGKFIGTSVSGGGGGTLISLTDVDSSNLGDGRFLRYDASTSDFTFAPVSATNLELIAGDIQSGILTTNSTNQEVVMSISASTYRSVQYQVQVTEGTNYNTTSINLIHDGTTTYMSEYGTINQPIGVATFSSDISGGALRLLGYPAFASTTTFKTIFTAIES
jgi:pyruvate-formate lyase-activating enzyme